MLDVRVDVEPAREKLDLGFRVDEDDFAAALSDKEARFLIKAIIRRHGVEVFDDVANEVIGEFLKQGS